MFSSTTSVVMVGAEPRPVRVEVHVGRSKEAFRLSGLPDTAVREAKDRVRAAVVSSGLPFPNQTVTVNLSPADLPKAGAFYDLPIALGVLGAAGTMPSRPVVAVGELALDGSVRPGRGALGAAIVAGRLGVPCLVAMEDAAEAGTVEGADVRPVASLAQAVSAVHDAPAPSAPLRPSPSTGPIADLADVRGQVLARRALEVAAAGGHHLLMSGPPGSGKTMLARRLPGLLPPLDPDLALEVACLWAAAGISRGVDSRPPFRSPHHTASLAALVGGGTGILVPGELSLGHGGVLFLDELGEFPAGSLDALRQPLEEGSITLARRGISACFPARVQLVAATNPCPCGYAGDRSRACSCPPPAVARYRRRISGPLLDRFDLRVSVRRLDSADVTASPGEPSAAVGERVAGARAVQAARGCLSSRLDRRRLDALPATPAAGALLAVAVDRTGLTARGFDRVRRVARTLADLAGRDRVGEEHVAEALTLRGSW